MTLIPNTSWRQREKLLFSFPTSGIYLCRLRSIDHFSSIRIRLVIIARIIILPEQSLIKVVRNSLRWMTFNYIGSRKYKFVWLYFLRQFLLRLRVDDLPLFAWIFSGWSPSHPIYAKTQISDPQYTSWLLMSLSTWNRDGRILDRQSCVTNVKTWQK